MRVLFLDCFSGISGDMTVGALCDLGVKPSSLEWELGKVDLGDFHMHFDRAQRQSVTGVKFSIHEGATHHEPAAQGEEPQFTVHAGHGHGWAAGHAHSHGHAGHHGHVHGRSHAQIRKLIEESDLSPFVKKHALSMFHRVAVAEGKIHGVPPEDVGFHEVGALDSIADIICVCVGLEQLGVEKVLVSPLHDGQGWIECAHGRFPIPSAATLEILAGIPVRQIEEPFEFITPTGAAIVAEFGSGFGPMPTMRVEKIGYGIGTRELASRPNVLRAVLGEIEESAETDTVTRIETNLDDLSPEITGALLDKLLKAGALDAFLTPIQMKKNRPAVQLSVLCEEAAIPTLTGMIFAETTAFGLRMDPVRRLKLERRFETVETEFGPITIKLGFKEGQLLQVAPEFESCREASERTSQPLRVVYERAIEAYRTKNRL